MSQPVYSPENVPIWVCPSCGRVESIPIISTAVPNLICGCLGYQNGVCHMSIMAGNKAANAVMKSIDRFHVERAESRRRAEEALRDWPPAATMYDWSLRRG